MESRYYKIQTQIKSNQIYFIVNQRRPRQAEQLHKLQYEHLSDAYTDNQREENKKAIRDPNR